MDIILYKCGCVLPNLLDKNYEDGNLIDFSFSICPICGGDMENFIRMKLNKKMSLLLNRLRQIPYLRRYYRKFLGI